MPPKQPTPGRTGRDTPPLLTKQDEAILKTVHNYRFMTALDVTHRLYSPASLVYMRRLCTALAGGADGQTRNYLYRFPLPGASPNPERVYTLGSRGRVFLASELGLDAGWYFRPEKMKHVSYSQVLHHLTLTRFLCAAHRWCGTHPAFRLDTERLCYELAHTPAQVRLPQTGSAETQTVIPDAWLLFEERAEGAHLRWLPVLLEIDRGTEYQQKFKQHVRARIAFVQSGAYRTLFGTEAVRIAYATTGETPAYRETRRRSMCAWTMQVLAELHLESWAPVFRFCSLVFADLYATPLFDGSVWYRPDQPEPVPLFAA